MRIWLIAEGESLPIDKNGRLMRMGSLAKYLSENGHEVIWFTSTFIHGTKKYITKHYEEIRISDEELLVLLHSKIVYKKNVSLRRIMYCQVLAKEFEKKSKLFGKPDVILSAWPLPETSKKAVEYGRVNDIPVILDARDMWPDIFERAFPNIIRKLGSKILIPMKKSAKEAFSLAYGISGMIDAATEWGCRYAGRKPGENDKTIYIGNQKTTLTDNQYRNAIHWWNEKGVNEADWNICFISTFGTHIAVDTVIKAVKELSERYPNIKLVLGGSGDREEEFRKIADGSPNIVFAGWIDNIQMTSLMMISKCGAFSIMNSFDFKDTFNNKAIQYISEGLPILNSLSGFANTLITQKDMGLTYDCDNVKDCKDKILQLYNNEERRKQMGKNGLKCFYEMFESEVVNRQFERYLLMITEKYKKEHGL